MRAWRVHELGEPEAVLRLDDITGADPPPGHVAVDVAAASLNFPDVLMCRGEYQVKPRLPFTPGAEVSGRVNALGDGVDAEMLGRRVIAIPRFGDGGFTERTVAPVSTVFPIPDTLDDTAAAALHVTYQTGHVGLHRRARIQAGETLLVHAGAGGVGSAAIQLGLAAGAHVIATAGGAEKVQVCRDLGAELVIDYRAGDFVDAVKEFTDGRGADVVYDPVGGDTYDRSTKCIAFEGRILIIGFTGGRFADARTNHVLIKNYAVVGVHWGMYNLLQPEFIHATHDALMELHAAGRIAPLISREIGMADVPGALARLGAAPAARGADRRPLVNAGEIVGLLADPDRRRVVAAMILGASTGPDIARTAGIDTRAVATALHRLSERGLVIRDGEHAFLVEEAFATAARAAAAQPEPVDPDVDPEVARVMRAFVRDGRITQIPMQHAKRRVLLEWLVQDFEPGRRYSEPMVNLILGQRHADTAALRRGLVDEELMDRDHGEYWRIGGPVDTAE